MTRFPTPAQIERDCRSEAARVRRAEQTITRLEYAIDRCHSYETGRQRRVLIGDLRRYVRTLHSRA